MRTIISTKGHIILPAEIRREDDIKSGQEFEIERIGRGESSSNELQDLETMV